MGLILVIMEKVRVSGISVRVIVISDKIFVWMFENYCCLIFVIMMVYYFLWIFYMIFDFYEN